MSAKILIAAGGTGGHIYPALALAAAFAKLQPQTGIEFVGTAHGLENQLIPPKGYKVHPLPIGRLNSNVSWPERLKTLLLMPLALVKSAVLLRRARPDLVLGMGGHASGPLLLMAALLKYRTAIWEPNAMPGLANRILASFVDECWVVFDEAKTRLKNSHLHRAGMPVRAEIEGMRPSRHPAGTFNILVFGGSQGARGINSAVCEMMKPAGDWQGGLHIVHQTGAADFERVLAAYGELAKGRVEVKAYIHDMATAYAAADLVICRSGTGTLSELAACGLPAVLIPLATAADDHQTKNAESLVTKNAALMVLQKDLSPQRLRDLVVELRRQPERLSAMGAAIRAFHQPQAAETLVKAFIERIGPHALS